jgi:ComF family protein
MNKFFARLISSLFTERCPYCNAVVKCGEIACDSCKPKIPQPPYRFFANGGYMGYSAFPYKDIYANAVKRFKFNNNPQCSSKLAIPLKNAVEELLEKNDFDYITCVPMHKRREDKRGYNQAKLLAKDLSKLVNIPYADLIEKHKDNVPQHKCKGSERVKNVKGVYRAVNKEMVKDKNILVIDDIITSGSTLGECCKVLRKAGAKTICCGTMCVVIYT